jgi:Co/Zn/Cd efflux system component
MMILVSILALIANLVCLLLLSKHRDGEVHMKASWIFSSNDVVANVGVIVAGILVTFLGSNLPDLIIGIIVGLVVLRGAFTILKLSK